MSRPLLLAFLCLAAPSRAADKPRQTIARNVSFQAPKGWQAEEYANGGGADPVQAFASGEDRIVVRVFGAPGSGYKDPAAFLGGAAASTMGRRPEKAGETTVAGRSTVLFRRGFPLNQGDPHTPSGGQPPLGREIFLILTAPNGRFVVLSYARSTPIPDLERRGEKAWAAFLKTVKPAGVK